MLCSVRFPLSFLTHNTRYDLNHLAFLSTMRDFKRSVHSIKLNYGSMSKNCFTPLLRAPEPKADTVIVLVRLGRSMRLNRGERKRRRRSRRRSGDVSVCWGRGAAPPIIKLACCAGGPCLQGRRGSFLHSVDSSEPGDGSSEHSLLSLVISANHPSLRCDWRTAHTGWFRTSRRGEAATRAAAVAPA